jgi:DNA recombination protein RmuC
LQAKTIRDSYVSPPFTTDFAILFVPTEGLYAEMMSRAGFAELLQRDYRVTLTGPTNFLALLNSLQMGFRTLAIEQRSSEVWKVLAAVKTDFTKFGEILGRTQKKLQEASNTIDEARGKSTTIARKLRDVEALPEVEADRLLASEPRLVYDADADADIAPDGDVDIDPPQSRDGR